jgi:hypothetical protein
MGARHRKDSLHTVGRNRAERRDCVVQFAVEENQKVHIIVPWDESRVSVEGMFSLGYGRK